MHVGDSFYGNRAVAEALENMVRQNRVPHAILLSGPEGVGKATLARRFAARLLGRRAKIEEDDLSLPQHVAALAEREKLPSEKRADDPLMICTDPDFITFPPDGPLRQISIQQMRLLRNQAQLRPHKGNRRVFLIDHLDRANEQAANSLLKTLEEPPDYLVLVLTAENPYDLLPTIRSRAVPFHLSPAGEEEMRQFAAERRLDHVEQRIALAAGCPGVAVSLDLEAYRKRRTAMLALLETASGRAPFAAWAKHADLIAARKTEKLEPYLQVLYLLLGDLLVLQSGAERIRNTDIREALESLAAGVSFEWLRAAARRVDELAELVRRNIQKSIALDAFAASLPGCC